MRLALVTVAAGTLLGLTAAASADPSVTLPFTLTAGAGQSDSITSTLTLDAAPGYEYTFEISNITLNAMVLGITPAPLNAVTEGDVLPAELVGAGSTAALPSMLFDGHFDSSENVMFPNGFDFDVSYEALADGSLRTTLTVNSLGTYKNGFTVIQNVTITGTAIAQAVPVPAPAAAAGFLGLGGLALRRRR